MGTELMSGPFRYIVHVAQLFKKTEQDMKELEDILMSLHKNISSSKLRSSQELSQESNSDDVASHGCRLKSEKGKSRIMVMSKVNNLTKIQAKIRIQCKDQTNTDFAKAVSQMNFEEQPHWFVRTIEFYASIYNAFGDLRKYLKNACKEYARAMINCVRYYKQCAGHLENNIDPNIQSIKENYEKKIAGLNSMIQVCEQQRETITENKMRLLSEIEITTVEIICIKETTLKLIPSIITQENLQETASQNEEKTKKLIQNKEEYFKMLKKAKIKLGKHNEQATSSRKSFMREMNKMLDKLTRAVEDSEREAEKLRRKELNKREISEFEMLNHTNLKNEIDSLKEQSQEAEKKLEDMLDDIERLKEGMGALGEEEKRVLCELQTACIISHKDRNDLKKILATSIKKLHNILYVSKINQDNMIIPIENQIPSANESYENICSEIETLEEYCANLADRIEKTVDAREDLKSILENVQSKFQELEINLIMLENGFKKFVRSKETINARYFYYFQDEESLIDTSTNAMENVRESEYFKYKIHKMKMNLIDLRTKEILLQRYISSKKLEAGCLKESTVSLAHAYLSIMMLPASDSFGEICHVSLAKDKKLETLKMPDILMTGLCCSIDSSITHIPTDEQSKCSSKSKKKTKKWEKFEKTLRRNLVNELRRVIK